MNIDANVLTIFGGLASVLIGIIGFGTVRIYSKLDEMLNLIRELTSNYRDGDDRLWDKIAEVECRLARIEAEHELKGCSK